MYVEQRNVLPVLATPDIENKSFYETAIKSLQKAKTQERTLHPHHKYNGNIEVSFFNKRKRSEFDTLNLRPEKRVGLVLESAK